MNVEEKYGRGGGNKKITVYKINRRKEKKIEEKISDNETGMH